VVAEMPIALARTERRDRDTLAALRAELARLAGHPIGPKYSENSIFTAK